MSTLAEIEEAADALSDADQEALLRFLAVSLRKERTSEPRVYTDEELADAGRYTTYFLALALVTP